MTVEFYGKIERNGGIYDTKKYRYCIDSATGNVKRIELDALDTTAALTDKSEYNPYGWETIKNPN